MSILIIISLIALSMNLKLEENKIHSYSFTKAICEKNICQDFLITCQNDKPISSEPITEKIKMSPNWKDPRIDSKNLDC